MENNNKPILNHYFRRGNEKDVIVHTSFQGPDGLFQVGDKRLTEDEVDKLMTLMPEHRWVLITWADPRGRENVRFSDPDMVDMSRLKDETLREIAEERTLSDKATEDIINTLKYESKL